MGISLVYWDQNFVPSLDIGSVWSVGPGLRTSALTYNSRSREVNTFLSSDSDSTQNLASIGYLVDFSDSRVPSYGSVSGLRLENRGV